MSDRLPDFAALIGSRICHDLISPLGAIGNGVELLSMSGAGGGPELALIADSVANANARIRFFRIAYGAAAGEVAEAEIRSILTGMADGGRVAIDWRIAGPVSRARAKLAFLALQCLETALPFGGTVTVTVAGAVWEARADGARLAVDAALWSNLTAPAPDPAITPAQLQFALLPVEAGPGGIDLRQTDGSVTIRF